MSSVARGCRSVFSKLSSILHQFSQLCSFADDVTPDAETAVPQDVPVRQNHNQNDIKEFWPQLMVAFCLASAFQIAIISIQNYQLRWDFYLLSLALLLSFTSFFMSAFINNSKFRLIADRLRNIGLFFGAAAFFIAIAIPVPIFLKCLTGFIFVFAVAVIWICN